MFYKFKKSMALGKIEQPTSPPKSKFFADNKVSEESDDNSSFSSSQNAKSDTNHNSDKNEELKNLESSSASSSSFTTNSSHINSSESKQESNKNKDSFDNQREEGNQQIKPFVHNEERGKVRVNIVEDIDIIKLDKNIYNEESEIRDLEHNKKSPVLKSKFRFSMKASNQSDKNIQKGRKSENLLEMVKSGQESYKDISPANSNHRFELSNVNLSNDFTISMDENAKTKTDISQIDPPVCFLKEHS